MKSRTKSYKPLTEPLHKSGGRNNHGELTSWWRGGGHKRNYRVIDFKRDKRDISRHRGDYRIRSERSARIALRDVRRMARSATFCSPQA